MILKTIKYYVGKWYLILLVTVIVGGGFFFVQARQYNRDKGGNGETIQIDVYKLINFDVTTVTSNGTGDIVNYDYSLLWKRPTLLAEFADQCTLQYDMDELCPGWNEMALRYQVKWLQENVEMYYLPSSFLYELRFINEVDISLKEEKRKLMESFMQDFMDYSIDCVKMVEPDIEYTVFKESTYIRDQFVDTSSTYTIKSAVLSVFFGGLTGILVVTVMLLVKNKSKARK